MGQAPQELLRRHGLRAYKALGQHFLTRTDVAQRQVDYAWVNKDDIVLEVGPGLGTLTRIIAATGCKIIAVEKDRTMARILQDEIGPASPKLQIIEGDVLEMDLPALGFNKIVSNIPYNISSELTLALVKCRFDVAVIMFQHEFAQRLTAEPGTKAYSRLTVGVRMRADVEMLETVPATAFHPRPKVDSALVRLRPTDRIGSVKDPVFFDKVVEALFSQRRKKLKNTLSTWGIRLFGTRHKMDLSGVPYGDRRPEELSLDQMMELVEELHDLRTKLSQKGP